MNSKLHNIKIKTITPIIIGSGNKYDEFNYFIDNNYLYRLNINECLNFIYDKFKDRENLIILFDDWLNNKLNQSLFNSSRQNLKISIFDFILNYLKFRDIYNSLIKEIVDNQKFYYYKIDVKSNPKGKTISELLKSPNYEIYIPGSSIKGLIRTILIKKYLKNKNNMINLKTINDFKRLENEIFYCGRSDFNGDKYDIMKFIHIGDSEYKTVSDYSILIETGLLLSNKKEIQVQSGYFEAIKEGISFNLQISIDTIYLYNILNSNQILKNEWYGIDDKFKNLFNINLLDFKDNLVEMETIILNEVNEIVYDISFDSIDNELNWLNKIASEGKNYDIVKNHYKNFLTNLDDDKSFVKLGHGIGISNISINNIKSKSRLFYKNFNKFEPIGWIEFEIV